MNYRNAALPIADRVADLLSKMTLEEKAGQMMQNSVGAGMDGELVENADGFSSLGIRDRVVASSITHMNVHALPEPRLAARWANRMQELAASTRLGIPLTISSDPRHAFSENVGVSFAAGYFSRWPEHLGLASVRDPELVREYANVVRQEYRAVGIASSLHPTIDLATSPRWARQLGTFGQDAALTSELVTAYLAGIQGAEMGPSSVAAMTKHFPGGGPQRGGEDPHFPYGREQDYPGGAFETHLEPFRAAIAAGTSALMPYYGMPVGLVRNGEAIEEVGFGFNRQVLTGILREELGFTGVICTDWGLVSDTLVPAGVFGDHELRLPARAWGVEQLDALARVEKILDAGADQFGGEDIPELIVELVRSGRVDESRIDASVARLLTVKFQLGLFENPFVDEDAASELVGNDDFVALGEAAQRRAITVLSGEVTAPTRVFLEGLSAASVPSLTVVDDPADADLAIVRLAAPFDPRDEFLLESMFHAGSLTLPADQVARVAEIAAAAPTLVDVFLDRPAILAPLVDLGVALTASFGSSDAALLDVVLGHATAEGVLPFDIPSSEEAVDAARVDVAGDTADPTFKAGFGVKRLAV